MINIEWRSIMIKDGQFYFFFLVDDSATEIWFKNSVFIPMKVHDWYYAQFKL